MAYQLWQFQKKKRVIRSEYLDYWESTVQISGTGRPVDTIISPAAPYAAPSHGKNKFVSCFCRSSSLSAYQKKQNKKVLYRYTTYTVVWNGLNYAAASFPVSTVDPAIDVKKPPQEFLSKADKSIYNLCVSMSL